MNLIRLIKIVSFACFGLGTAVTAFAGEKPRDLIALFGSQANLDAVRLAHEVDACILKRIPAAARPGKPAGPDQYEETTFVPVPGPLIADLSEKLLDARSFVFPAKDGVVLSKFCVPVYQVRLRFQYEEQIVTIDFCFGCGIARTLHNGREINSVDFDPSYAAFRNAFVTLFPHDETLKKTKPKL